MRHFKAVFWDVDGVVVISEPLHVEKINKTAQKYGIYLSDHDWQDFTGIGDHRIYKDLQKRGLPISEDAFLQECLDYYQANANRLEVRDGFKTAFNYMAGKGLVQASVSNGVREQVETNLDIAAVKMKMAFNLSASDISDQGLETKPSADPYMAAIEKINATRAAHNKILPTECLVIEDSGSGVLAGDRACMHAIHWRATQADKISQYAKASAYDAPSFIDVVKQLVP